MATISRTGIVDGQVLYADHVTRVIDALDGTSAAVIVGTGSFTGSFKGTFDGQVTSASFASTASYYGGSVVSASHAVTSSYSNNSIYAINSSFTTTASFVTLAQSASYVTLAKSASFVTTAQTASYVALAQTASLATRASGSLTGSLLGTAATASFVTLAQTASFITLAQTASFVALAKSASYVQTAQTASFVTLAQTASFVALAQTASLALRASGSLTGSLLGTAATASFVALAQTASLATRASGSLTGSLLGIASTASFVTLAQSASFVTLAQTASFITTAQTASFVTAAGVFGPFGASSVASSSYAATSSFAPSTNGDILFNSASVVSASAAFKYNYASQLVQLTGSMSVSSSFSTQGSRIRKYRTITLTNADWSPAPSQGVTADDDIILIIDNMTTSGVLGEANFNVANLLYSPAGRCVEIVKVKDGSGGSDIVLAATDMATGVELMLNNTSYPNGHYVCQTVGSSITLMSMGLALTGSAWGNGF